MSKTKKIWVIAGCLVFGVAILVFITLSFSNISMSEKKIANFLYTDQPTQALRETRILLFFHPTNVYGIRVLNLLTSDDIHYP